MIDFDAAQKRPAVPNYGRKKHSVVPLMNNERKYFTCASLVI